MPIVCLQRSMVEPVDAQSLPVVRLLWWEDMLKKRPWLSVWPGGAADGRAFLPDPLATSVSVGS